MNKPASELDLMAIAQQAIDNKKVQHRSKVLTYILLQKGLLKDFDSTNMQNQKLNDKGIVKLHHYYHDELLFKEYTQKNTGKRVFEF